MIEGVNRHFAVKISRCTDDDDIDVVFGDGVLVIVESLFIAKLFFGFLGALFLQVADIHEHAVLVQLFEGFAVGLAAVARAEYRHSILTHTVSLHFMGSTRGAEAVRPPGIPSFLAASRRRMAVSEMCLTWKPSFCAGPGRRRSPPQAGPQGPGSYSCRHRCWGCRRHCCRRACCPEYRPRSRRLW